MCGWSTMKKIIIILISCFILTGCQYLNKNLFVDGMSQKDAEVYEFLIRRHYKRYVKVNMLRYITDEINFLTFTPKPKDNSEWNPKDPPAFFFERISDLKVKYKKPSGCEVKNGSVYEKKSKKRARLRWYTIIKWIDDNTVEVEEGHWSGPLNGGASKAIYKKENGKWQRHKALSRWMS